MVRDEDADLVRAALDGDGDAFGQLVARYQQPLYNLALRITGDVDDAMDITQASFVKAYDGLAAFDPSRPFFSWLYRIGVHESLNWVRRDRKVERLPENFDGSATGDDPEQALARKQDDLQISGALLQLSAEHRAVVTLRHFQGLDYRETAEALGISVDLVRSRLFAARRRLRELLAALGGER